MANTTDDFHSAVAVGAEKGCFVNRKNRVKFCRISSISDLRITPSVGFGGDRGGYRCCVSQALLLQ